MDKLNLEKLWKDSENIINQKHLLIVCNTKTTNLIGQGAFNLNSEYFSDDEFEEIVAMFSSIGIPIDFFTYEDDFFKYILKLKKSETSNIVVYNAAQSGYGAGRKSLIPAFCNLHNLNYTGSNAYVVALCRQKFHVNKILSELGVQVPKTWLYSNGWLLNKTPLVGTKILLKPIYESASIGINSDSIKIYEPKIDKYIRELEKNQNQPIIAQEFISGYEVEVPLIRVGNTMHTFNPVGISIDGVYNLKDGFLDYGRIYFDEYEFYDFNEKFKKTILLKECVNNVSFALGMEGLSRIDFRIQSDGTFYLTDVSTNPHFVSHSSVNFAFDLLKLTPNHIAKTIIASAIMKG